MLPEYFAHPEGQATFGDAPGEGDGRAPSAVTV